MAVDYDRIKGEIAYFLGTPEGEWDSYTTTTVDNCITKGIDAVVHNGKHQWSWMRPRWAWSTADGQRRYDLPEDFEQFIGAIHFDADAAYPDITQRPAARLMQLFSEYDSTGIPVHYAIEATIHDGARQQGKQLVLHPTPNGEYGLAAVYQVGPIRPLSDSHPYPPGGQEFGELFVAACLAAAELKFKDMKADKHDDFQAAMVSAIASDYRKQPRSLGQMGGSRGRSREWYRWKLETQYDGSTDL